MAIPLSKPITEPAKPALTCDSLWISGLHINAPGLSQKASVSATLMPFNSTTGQLADISSAIVVHIPDLFAEAAATPEVAAAMNMVLEALKVVATKQGKLS